MTRHNAVACAQDRPEQDQYEPPRITVLGSLAEITLGHPGPKSDGTNPGSLL